MQLITGTQEFKLSGDSAVAIGKFDGLHRGHRQLLEQILCCKKQGLITAVFTFDPTPASFFTGKAEPELSTREEKRRLLAGMGIDVLIEFPLNQNTAAMEPERFIGDILVGQMNMKQIAAGTDLTFGKDGTGDRRLLECLQETYGYQVRIIEKITEQGRIISSTYIREAVEDGRMELAKSLLGAPYGIIGQVVHGQKLGRTIGMPTVNLLPEPQKQLPPNGVYYSTVKWNQQILCGITNIGCKPTVNHGNSIGVETYLYDFEGDIYGQELTVSLLHYKRPEQRFHSVDELKAQMQKDITDGRTYHMSRVQMRDKA